MAGVAVDVDGGDAAVDDIRALPKEVVYGFGDDLFVAGNGGGGYDDGIAGLDFDVAVFAVGYADEG